MDALFFNRMITPVEDAAGEEADMILSSEFLRIRLTMGLIQYVGNGIAPC